MMTDLLSEKSLPSRHFSLICFPKTWINWRSALEESRIILLRCNIVPDDQLHPFDRVRSFWCLLQNATLRHIVLAHRQMRYWVMQISWRWIFGDVMNLTLHQGAKNLLAHFFYWFWDYLVIISHDETSFWMGIRMQFQVFFTCWSLKINIISKIGEALDELLVLWSFKHGHIYRLRGICSLL